MNQPGSSLPTPPFPVPGRPLVIDLWCNHVAGGWEPAELETFLGGSEACLVLWGEALVKRGHRVRIFHNAPHSPGLRTYAGVEFHPHEQFDPFTKRDVLVTWKSPHPWWVGASAPVRIHWSSEVEAPWPDKLLSQVQQMVSLTPFHAQTMPWVPEEKSVVIPHGIDFEHLEAHRQEKIPGLAMYASSPDRGLETLLLDWPRIRANHPGINLEVFYGWKVFQACTAGNQRARDFERVIDKLVDQPGITYRGAVSRREMAEAYWRSEFWMLPLNKAESELFCLNAVKAHISGATAVINRTGALEDTAGPWIDYQNFLGGEKTPLQAHAIPPQSWEDVVALYWEPLFYKERFLCIS